LFGASLLGDGDICIEVYAVDLRAAISAEGANAEEIHHAILLPYLSQTRDAGMKLVVESGKAKAGANHDPSLVNAVLRMHESWRQLLSRDRPA